MHPEPVKSRLAVLMEVLVNDDRSIMMFMVATALIVAFVGGFIIWVVTRNDDLPPGTY